MQCIIYKKIKLSMFRFLLILSIFFSAFSYSDEIKEIKINGLNSLPRGTILSYLPVEIGDNFNEQISDLSIQKLYKTGLIKDIFIDFKDGTLSLNIQENPVISYFEIKGFKNDRVLNEDSVELVLKDLKLVSGSVFNKSVLDKFIKKLDEQYNQSGHYKAKINVEISEDDQNRVGVLINIDEGAVAKIKTFKILGAKEISSEKLLDFFEIGEPDFFLLNLWTDKDFYSEIKLNAGIEKIKSHYLSEGFLDFEILEKNIILSDNKEEINISIKLSEGPIYKIGELDFSGDFLNIDKKSFYRTLGVSSGDIFKRQKLIEGLEKISNFFGDQGFAYAKVNADTNQNAKLNTIDVNVKIDVNDRIFINRIVVTGNNRTQDDVIRREINLLEGQQYSREELDKSISNIRRLGYFKTVDMTNTKVPGKPDKVDLNFVVDESKTGELSIGLSQSSSTGAAFNFGIKEKNFLGTGNTLNASFVNSEAVEDLSFFFSNPDFNGKKHTLGYGAFSRTTDAASIDLNSYKLNEVGVNASYGIPITEYAKFTNGFRLASIDLKCGAIIALYESDQCSKSTSDLDFSFITSISENSLNDSMYPSDGRTNNIKIDIGLPLADLNYYKIDLSHSSYYPFSENLTWKINGSLGFLDSYGSKSSPFFKKYFGGGSTSIRGFDFNSLGPKYPNNSIKGGEVSLLASSSVISPITFIDDSENMRMGAFVDIGSITESISDFSFNDIRASTGFGFSWYTPIGPIAAYWSKPIISKSSDSLQTFSFNLGASF